MRTGAPGATASGGETVIAVARPFARSIALSRGDVAQAALAGRVDTATTRARDHPDGDGALPAAYATISSALSGVSASVVSGMPWDGTSGARSSSAPDAPQTVPAPITVDSSIAVSVAATIGVCC